MIHSARQNRITSILMIFIKKPKSIVVSHDEIFVKTRKNKSTRTFAFIFSQLTECKPCIHKV